MGDTYRILLKVTGEIFLSTDRKTICADTVHMIATQIKKLNKTHQFGIVIGGGNFFRGNAHGSQLGITQPVAHTVGMLSTLMNTLMLKDIFEQHDIATTILTAIACPSVGEHISQHAIDTAFAHNKLIIFAGGTGNPFFTTDTNAVLRGLQIHAHEVWKGTKVLGIYSANPAIHTDAQLISHITYADALRAKIGIMDATALTLAQTHNQVIRVFDIFKDNALIHAANDSAFGSKMTSS